METKVYLLSLFIIVSYLKGEIDYPKESLIMREK